MNKIILIGRMVKDSELRVTQTGAKIGSFTLAVNRTTKNENGFYEADFFNCKAFNKTAEILNQYTKKGSQIGIEGRIQNRSYEDSNGIKKYVTEILVSELQLLDSKKPEETDPFQSEEFITVDDTDELPF